MNRSITDIIEEYRKLGIGEQLDYDKFYLYSIITHSTAIEGSTITEVENRLLFDEGIGAEKPLIEQQMNIDLKAAYERSFALIQTGFDFSIKLLCELSSLVMKNTGSEYKTISGNFSAANGDLRLLNVSAGFGGRSYISWQKVPERLAKFCDWLNEERQKIDKADIEAIYDLSFEAHYRLVNIHPWADGNGRISRLVMNMIQREFEVVPSIVKKECRKQYIVALEQSEETENSDIFKSFMLTHHRKNLIEQIDEYKSSMEGPKAKSDFGSQKSSQKNQKSSQKIIEMLRNDAKITTQEIAERMGISRRAVAKTIAKLKADGIIRRVGPDKGGFWEIIG